GGTGTLGALLAEHLVTTWNITHLHLTSRRGPHAPGAPELTQRLRQLGATVHITATDATDTHALHALIDNIDPTHPLTAVIHTAGTTHDAVLTAQTPQALADVWTAKANYAAANAYLDALATDRTGHPTTSVAWGLWATTSTITGKLGEADLARMARTGVTPLTTEKALALFDAALEHGSPQLAAVGLDVPALAAQPASTLPAAMRGLAARPGGATRRAAAAQQQPDDWARRLAGLPAADRRQQLLALVRSNVATVLGHADAEGVLEQTPFTDLGFDSLTGVELRNRLSAATGLRLPAALVFDFPSAGALADHLLGRLVPDGSSAAQDGADAVLGELARLEGALAALDLPEADARAVTGRLEGLLAQWKAASAPPAEDSAADRLALAGTDEVLAFIDRELGAS
ncbi:beta-ketoacyl reductase, partial [Streptomyces sp. NRRL F-5123]|uniref:beta-ketoacyl reductase n=1 Tax=Streptomyces sp. NRRL F-5123 TaxID=1463856 RepID=UPI0004E28974